LLCPPPDIDLAAARPFIRTRAAMAGLSGEKPNLIQAVIEVLSNALAHGAPPCRRYIYTEGPALVCHVHDSGPGLVNHLISYLPPGNGTSHGRGIWVARQLCDSLHIASDETGTHVAMRVILPGDRAPR